MIVLLTDFGLKDAYVGVMKGVILSIAPHQQILDLTHHIQAQNISHANTILLDNYQYFPEQSIFCCVVDPGVGTERRSIVVQNKDYIFIGPDNGLFTNLIHQDSQVFLLNTPINASYTFHGRDIYAPTSAKVSIDPSYVKQLSPIDYKSCCTLGSLLISDTLLTKAKIIYSDHFGNLISNIKKANLPHNFKIIIKKQEVPFFDTYQQIPDHTLGALFSSSNRLEIAIKNGSALDYFIKYKLELIFDIIH